VLGSECVQPFSRRRGAVSDEWRDEQERDGADASLRFTQAFGYDALNRVTSAVETSGTTGPVSRDSYIRPVGNQGTALSIRGTPKGVL